ncbi:proteinase inhibitor I4 serpin (DUF716) [Citrus sinensis]|uniref:Proteinase inhibitor I4 serpin (DUF716) n=1 Tax=Citrus sinensis TaxID=2711 RepID=A0ACB8MTN2_CITSI|nr:proteinase inhibitor I4 serpin (DUF716) [Citrus sinensis]KAH9789243.1 proteinase inhibitor I4 serpin (DUF716) [Citrus sinensis]
MGTLVGHVAPGFAFLALGLWHLLNHIKLHSLRPNSYTSAPWFPTSRIKYLELYMIMLALSIVLDKTCSKLQYGLTQFLGAIAFGQQFLLFHLHSADHMGVEGQYHLLLQIVVLVSLITTLLGIGYPKSFLVSFVRSASIFFQGAWFILMGYMLWTPSLIPKGCFINSEEGHQVVRCHGAEALHRAKSLVNLQFSWFLIGVTIFSVSLYLVLDKFYGDQKVEYSSLTREEDEDSDDVESQKEHKLDESKSFIAMGKKVFASVDMER